MISSTGMHASKQDQRMEAEVSIDMDTSEHS